MKCLLCRDVATCVQMIGERGRCKIYKHKESERLFFSLL